MGTMNAHNEPLAVRSAAMLGADIERVLIQGDLSKLTPDQRVSYYNAVCESVGLNPLTRPFEYITLNGKLQLYARRECTDQLRKIHGVSIKIAGREMIGEAYVVTAQATDKGGRTDESTGVLCLGKLIGEALSNAMMKAETKAKRRVTLSICGLGLIDETEIEDAEAEANAPTPAQNASAEVRAAPKLAAKEEATQTFDEWYAIAKDAALQRGYAAPDLDTLLTKESERQGAMPGVLSEFHQSFLGFLKNGAYDAVLRKIGERRNGREQTKKVVNEAEQPKPEPVYQPIDVDELFEGNGGRKL